MTISTSRPSSSSTNRLEPLLLLAKSARGASAAKLIVEATATQGCYLFSELANSQGIKSLAEDSTYTSSSSLLKLFLYGTLSDYLASPASYPKLTQSHIVKLRQLTLVSLASSSRILDYNRLLEDLKLNVYITEDGSLQFDGMGSVSSLSSQSSAIGQNGVGPAELTNIRALEDVIIDAIYAGLLTGRLDQRSRRFHVDSVIGRDVGGEADLKQMEDSLRAWGDTTTALLSELSQRIDQAKAESDSVARARAAHDQALSDSLLAIQQRSDGQHHQGHSGGDTGPGGDDAMDVEADGDKKIGSSKKKTKRTRT